jgi:hypothetical protein
MPTVKLYIGVPIQTTTVETSSNITVDSTVVTTDNDTITVDDD